MVKDMESLQIMQRKHVVDAGFEADNRLS